MNTYIFQGYNNNGLHYKLATNDKNVIRNLQNQYTGNGNHFLLFQCVNKKQIDAIQPEVFNGIKFN